MPVMDGYSATEQIRVLERRSKREHTQIIALTAGNTNEDRLRCLNSGMDGHLSKPFTISDISQCLESTLSYDRNIEQSDITSSTRENKSLLQTNQQSEHIDTINMRAITNIADVEKQTGKPLLQEIFSGFRSQMIEKFGELEIQLSRGEMENISRTAHAIKSMSANVGAEQLKSIGSKIERKAKDNDATDMESLTKELNGAYSVFVEEFSERFKNGEFIKKA